MFDKTEVLATLARSNPDALSSDGWASLKSAQNGDGAKGSVSYPPELPGLLAEQGGWLRSDSGYLVTGQAGIDTLVAGKAPAVNSAIYACLTTDARHYTEPPMRLWRGPHMQIEASEPLDDHPINRLLRNPSRFWTMPELKAWYRMQVQADGNAYFIKVRTGGGDFITNTTGMVDSLLPVPAGAMWPDRFKGSTNPLDYFALAKPNGADPFRIPPENVVHIRAAMLDGGNLAKGMGAVRMLAREVASDSTAAAFVDAILTNLGVIGLLISPKEQNRAGMNAEQIRSYVEGRTTGANRARPMVFEQPTDLQQVKTDISALNLEPVWNHVETRIGAVMGVPAILAGLAAGLEAATYSNAETLVAYFTENVIMSAWQRDAEAWRRALAADFGLRDDEYLAFDYTTVRALQADEDAKWARVVNAWMNNVLPIEAVHQMLDLGDVDPQLAGSRWGDFHGGLSGMAAGFAPPAPVVSVTRAATPLLPAPKTADYRTKADGGEDITDDDLDNADADWQDWADTNAPKSKGWKWNKKRARYEDDNGREIPVSAVRAVAGKRADTAGSDLRSKAERLAAGALTVAAWHAASKGIVKGVGVELAMLGAGGRDNISDSAIGAVGKQIGKQLGYLGDFAKAVAGGDVPLEQVAGRAVKYSGAGMRATWEVASREAHKFVGYTEKRRVSLDDKDTCETCKDEAAQGWVEIDADGFELGETECMSNDRCEFEYRKGEGD